VNMDVTPYSQT